MFRKWFPLFLAFLFLTGSMMSYADYKTGEVYHGFKLMEKRFVKEVNTECLYFIHEKSGARLLKIAADDANKTFSISFKTDPESDAGTPHIMEHSVLNGSKKFPVKSPFDVLAKGSLNTFLNAMTGSDITVYPVASMNDKDYFNLMHVYLDAVFRPLIYDDPRILMQEGWHYEMMEEDGPVIYNGIVYNEMKGAFSSPTRELGFQIDRHLFPDNGYRFSSGGYPPAIPTLSYDAFLDYHRKYYHPSNSYIYLYGDADLDKELAFIDTEYLSDYKKSDAIAYFPLQMPFGAMKEVTAYYSAAEGGDTENQTYLSLSYVTGLNTDRKLAMAMDILREVLVNQESAPVRLALQEAGVGRDVRASTDEMKQMVFQIRVQNANPQDNVGFRNVVQKTLQEVAEKGLDREVVDATLNRMEFRLREGDDAQKGLTYNFQCITGWFFAEDPFLSLEYEKPLAAIKKDIPNKYLEKIIQKYLIDNPHALLLTLEPKPGMEKENAAKAEKELAAYRATLSTENIKDLVKETQDLIAYQKRADDAEALATVPLLDLKDINPKAAFYLVDEKKVSGVPTLHYETFTNDVVYARLNYDLRVLPVELIPYASLLAEVMGSLNTDKYTYGDLDKALNMHTGGFSTFLNTYLENREDANLLPKFVISARSMNHKVEKMFELLAEIVNETKYEDVDRLKAVMTRHQSRLDANTKRNGLGYAMTRMSSYFSKDGMFNELTNGSEYYWFVTDLVNGFDEKVGDIIVQLQKTAELLFAKDNVIASTTCAKSDYKIFSGAFTSFAKTQSENKSAHKVWAFDFEKKNEALLTASKVQYVVQGYDYKKLGYAWDGKMRVMNQIISRDWLYNQIRVIGGAYGGFSNFGSNGRVYFASYRDPNLDETMKNYEGTVDYLNKFEANETDMTRYIIGTVARMDRPLTPSQKGNVAVRNYFEKAKASDAQKDRDAVLSTTPTDIKAMSKLVSDILAQKAYCVYGNESKIEENKDLFGKLVKLNK